MISLLSFEQTEKMRRRRAYIRKQQTVTERKTVVVALVMSQSLMCKDG